MRNVQRWSLVATLAIASLGHGQLLRSRRPCCQPTCQTCNYVQPATATVSNVSYVAPASTITSSETVVYAEPTTYEASAESSIVYESPMSESTLAYSDTVETPVIASAIAPTETIVSAYPSNTYVAPVSYSTIPNAVTMNNEVYRVRTTPRVTQTSYSANYTNASGDQMRVLSVVNEKRRRSGLPALVFDPTLTAVAQRKSYYRAMRGMTGHDGSSMGGAAVEGVGYSYGQSDPVAGFNTCYLYSNGYQRAGCAISYDANNRAYYTLLLR